MSDAVKFAYIALCFTTALLSYRFCRNKRDWAFLTAGLFCTLVSDYFLILHDSRLTGTAVFCFAHIAYIMRVSPPRYGWVLAATFVCAVPFAIAGDALMAAAGLYAVLFAQAIRANVIYYIKGTHRAPRVNRALTLAGLLLFALCDVNVLLYNLPRYISFPETIAAAAYRLIWFFYAPSQLLLAISAIRFKGR